MTNRNLKRKRKLLPNNVQAILNSWVKRLPNGSALHCTCHDCDEPAMFSMEVFQDALGMIQLLHAERLPQALVDEAIWQKAIREQRAHTYKVYVGALLCEKCSYSIFDNFGIGAMYAAFCVFSVVNPRISVAIFQEITSKGNQIIAACKEFTDIYEVIYTIHHKDEDCVEIPTSLLSLRDDVRRTAGQPAL